MKYFYVFVLLLISHCFFGQNSSISGSVVDDSNGGVLPGVNIIIKELKLSTTTDSDGKFVFRNVGSGSYEVEFSFIGYQSKIISEVVTKNNEITYLNTTLVEIKNELKEVVITRTKAKAESIKSLLVAQKNSITVSDGISAETIKRTPDRTTSDVLKRVSGVSIQDNKFVVIRGLNDRYNAALLNGAPLPSSEPDRKAFSFDIFPANMLDNLIITKTASPDMPGEFVGGVIQINTKSVPDKNFQSITVGSGYNAITTFKKQREYKGSSTDWLGFDNGVRDMPSTVPNKDVYVSSINGTEEAGKIAKTFEYDFSINDSKFKPNTAFQYSIGHHFDLGEKVFGVMFSVSHSITNNFNEIVRNSEWNNVDPVLPSVLISKFIDNNYSQQVLTGSLANFSMKFNENHSLSFKNILSINSNDLVVERSGKADVSDSRVLSSNVRWFTSNLIYSGQLNGDHYFTKPKIKLNWSGFYSNIQRTIPNLRRNVYLIADPDSSSPSLSNPVAIVAANNGGPDYGGGMFFSENSESISGGKFDISKKFNIGKELINEVKLGGFVQNRDRDFFARQLQYNRFSANFDPSLLTLTDATIFTKENMGVLQSGLNGFNLYDATKKTDDYIAGSKLNAAYIMLDNRYKKFRLIWGVRVEDFTQTFKADTDTDGLIDTKTRKIDILPSANFIFSINKKQNLRFSFSRTLNRPEYRELAPFGFYDFTTQFFTQGNKDLKRASIQNFDFRYEFFPSKNQLFTVSYFLKKFTNPIEVIQQALNKTITYANANSAVNSGVELEFRVLLSSIITSEKTSFFDDLTLFSNVAIIKSTADVTGINGANPETSRTMQGQSPYVLNAGLQYVNTEKGFIFSTNINRTGNRIAYASSEVKPAIWEKGRTFIDAQIAKSFFKNQLELKLNIQNILAQNLIFYQNNYRNTVKYGALETLGNGLFTGDFHYEDGYNNADDDIIWDTKFGRSFSLSATYNF